MLFRSFVSFRFVSLYLLLILISILIFIFIFTPLFKNTHTDTLSCCHYNLFHSTSHTLFFLILYHCHRHLSAFLLCGLYVDTAEQKVKIYLNVNWRSTGEWETYFLLSSFFFTLIFLRNNFSSDVTTFLYIILEDKMC